MNFSDTGEKCINVEVVLILRGDVYDRLVKKYLSPRPAIAPSNGSRQELVDKVALMRY